MVGLTSTRGSYATRGVAVSHPWPVRPMLSGPSLPMSLPLGSLGVRTGLPCAGYPAGGRWIFKDRHYMAPASRKTRRHRLPRPGNHPDRSGALRLGTADRDV